MLIQWLNRRHLQLLIEMQANERDALNIGHANIFGDTHSQASRLRQHVWLGFRSFLYLYD